MDKFKNILIVTDLDGTFLDKTETVPQSNIEAVEYFKANGGLFTIATGRVAEHVLGAIPDVDRMVNFPAVTCNGACLYDFQTGETPVSYVMSQEDVTDIVEYIREYFPTAGIRASSPEYCYVSTPDDMEHPLVKSDLSRYRKSPHFIEPLEEWRRVSIYKVVVRIDSDILPKAMETLKEKFGERFSVTQSWETIIDIQLGGVNKGRTLREYVGSTLGENVRIYACGDYVNDLELLTEADVSVCPVDSHPKIKEISQLCLCDNDDGLIAALVKYIEDENK